MTVPAHNEQDHRSPRWGVSIAVALLGFMGMMAAFATAGPAQDAAPGEDERKRPPAQMTGSTPSYTKEIQPLFNKRCVACHGCLGSPCNLKLTSFRALERGSLGKNPYSVHFEAYARTGMNVVQTTAEWRKRGFYPVLSRGGSDMENLSRSMLFQIVEAGARHNTSGFSRKNLMPLYAKRYDHQCPATPEALGARLEKNPGIGMPFGLPALEEQEVSTLRSWLAGNAPGAHRG